MQGHHVYASYYDMHNNYLGGVTHMLYKYTLTHHVYILPQDLFLLIDLCPFLESDKAKYDDNAVLSILKKHPEASCQKYRWRCGIGEAYPLAIVIALGGSLEVVQLLVDACPEALEQKLSGKRSVLHYSIAEGADYSIIQYLTSKNPNLVKELDSFNAIPLHLAATYPSSSLSVLEHLISIYPDGAKCIDHKSQCPLHRACRSRSSIEKVQALIEACPDVLFREDWLKTTPLGWAERLDHRLSDSIPEVVQLLEKMEIILTVKSYSDEDKYRAEQILAHFKRTKYLGGIRVAIAQNIHLVSLLDLPLELIPKLLSLFNKSNTDDKTEIEEVAQKRSIESFFSVLVQRPDLVSSAGEKSISK